MAPTNSPKNDGRGAVSWDNVDPFAEDDGTSGATSQPSSSHDDSDEKPHEDDSRDDKSEDIQKDTALAPKAVKFGGIEHRSSSSSDLKNDALLDKIRTHADDVGEGIMEKVKTAAHKFHLDTVKASGPSKWFNPTNVRMHVRFSDDEDNSDSSHPKRELAILWRSRDNRKGRNSIAVPLSRTASQEDIYRPHLAASLKRVGSNLWKMATTFPYWNMAFWSGWSYTWGSILFVISGAFAWVPIAFPYTEFNGETTYASTVFFLVGALLYQVGAVTAYLEAVNDGCFHGSAMRRLLEGHEEDQKKLLDDKIKRFFKRLIPHRRHKDEEDPRTVDPYAGWNTKDARALRPGSIYPTDKMPAASRRGGMDLGEIEEGAQTTYVTWQWYPSWHMLKTHHAYEIGYIATSIQLLGVTLYGVTAVVVFPLTFTTLADWQTLGAYWVPQIVASLCFLIASIMFMLETQEKWWKPEPSVMGWWVGVWSIIGSCGFELCAIFGTISLYSTGTWAGYQSVLSSTWGSFGYFVGSFLQWYEAINVHPLEEMLNEPGELKSWQIHAI